MKNRFGEEMLYSQINVLTPDMFCPFCLDELRRGIPENGICGHEELNRKIRDEQSHA